MHRVIGWACLDYAGIFLRIIGMNILGGICQNFREEFLVNTGFSDSNECLSNESTCIFYCIESTASTESRGDSFSEMDLEFPHVEVSLLDRLSLMSYCISKTENKFQSPKV